MCLYICFNDNHDDAAILTDELTSNLNNHHIHMINMTRLSLFFFSYQRSGHNCSNVVSSLSKFYADYISKYTVIFC